MKIILVYDISTENKYKNQIRKVCTKYLIHIQNSVFEGELESPLLLKLKKELEKYLDPLLDSIIIFEFKYNVPTNKTILGINKNDFDGYNI